MKNGKQEYTLTIYAENEVGLLNQITTIFTRRRINIESLTTSESALPGIHKFTLVIYSTEENVEKISGQIEKRIDVLKTYYFTSDEIIFQEIALYKVPTRSLTDGNQIEKIVRSYGARILEITEEYTVIEKTGHKSETQQLYNELKPYGLTQFTRSGRIAINKLTQEPLLSHLEALKQERISYMEN